MTSITNTVRMWKSGSNAYVVTVNKLTRQELGLEIDDLLEVTYKLVKKAKKEDKKELHEMKEIKEGPKFNYN